MVMEKTLAQKPVLVFDGDDTLWETMPLYSAAKRRFFQRMQRSGFYAPEVERVFEKRDEDNVGRYGFSRERFGISMVETYQHLFRTAGRELTSVQENEILSIANRVFSQPAKRTPYAEYALRSLQRNCRLVLLTKGDRAVQEQRIHTSKLAPYFEKVIIVGQKDHFTFSHALSELSAESEFAWSIGNSIRSDINPALANGMGAIWLPRNTWPYEEEARLASKRFITIRSLRQLPGVIRSWLSRKQP
jgi:putative hydrolase of the HAD superfamily